MQKISYKTILFFFVLFISLNIFVSPIYADTDTASNENTVETVEINDSVDDIVIPTTNTDEKDNQSENITQQDYDTAILQLKTLIENYGYYAKFDCEIISTPIYRKSVNNPNSKFYFSIIISELKKGQDVGLSFIDNVVAFLGESNFTEYSLTTSGDFNILTFNCHANDLLALDRIMGSAQAFVTQTEINGQNIYAMSFVNNNKNLTADQKYIFSNIQHNIIYKTTVPIQYNMNYAYKTNEKDYSVYKFNISPNEEEDISFYILEEKMTDMFYVNIKLQCAILLIFVGGFFAYYYFDNKKEE